MTFETVSLYLYGFQKYSNEKNSTSLENNGRNDRRYYFRLDCIPF